MKGNVACLEERAARGTRGGWRLRRLVRWYPATRAGIKGDFERSTSELSTYHQCNVASFDFNRTVSVEFIEARPDGIICSVEFVVALFTKSPWVRGIGMKGFILF
jgi:hypothetical protein